MLFRRVGDVCFPVALGTHDEVYCLGARPSWPNLKRFDVAWAHGSKVALVERRDLGLDETLGECHDAGIDDSERQISVARLQFAATGHVNARRRLSAVGTGK